MDIIINSKRLSVMPLQRYCKHRVAFFPLPCVHAAVIGMVVSGSAGIAEAASQPSNKATAVYYSALRFHRNVHMFI
jgi:hypothetical protein